MMGLTAMAAMAALAGCDGDQQALQVWMDETRRNTPPVHEIIAEPKRFEPFRYQAATQVDPFSTAKLQGAIEKLAARNLSGLKPDTARRREPLETFPLESVKLVGNLQQGKVNVALVEVEKLVYQARVGNYIGQNFGKVTRISETEVNLKELVQDAVGDWVERETSLRLQESTK
jgi:type IV pilus assembly protein PilP